MVFSPAATQAERDYYQIADTLIQAFLKAKFPESEQQEEEKSELEITETDSKGNTILLYGKDEDGRLVNRLSLDMVKNLETLKDSPVGTQIEGMPAVTVKVDGEVFLATDKDGTVVENKQSNLLDVLTSLTPEIDSVPPTLTVSENVNGDEVLLKGETSTGQSVDELTSDFKNQLDFLMSAPVGTDLSIGAMTIKSGNEVLFETDAQGKVVVNQMFPNDRDNIEDFEIRAEQEEQEEQDEIEAEIAAELEQERSEQVREEVDPLSWVDDMLLDEPEPTPEETQTLATEQVAVNQQIDEILDDAYEAMVDPEEEPEVSEGETRLDFEALVDVFSLNLQELVDRENESALLMSRMQAESEQEQNTDPLGAFFEGLSSDQKSEIEAQASLQISQASLAFDAQPSQQQSVSDNSPQAYKPTAQPLSSNERASVEEPSQTAELVAYMGSNIDEALKKAGDNQSIEDDKPRDGLSAMPKAVLPHIASALDTLPSSPTKDAMLGMVADMQQSKEQQEKTPNPEMEAFVARRKEEPQNSNWWQKVSSTLESTFGNVRDTFQNWRAATTLNKLAQSQALQSGESYEAAGFNLSREGNQYTLSDKEGNPKMRFESTILGVKVDNTLPPLSGGDFAKTVQLRADLDAGKEPSGAFINQAIHEGQYISRVNRIIKALSDYAKSQGGNAKVDGKLSYDFRANSKGSVMITDKEGNVLLAAGNGQMRSRMEEKDLAHFEKMIPALSQSNTKMAVAAQASVSAAPAAAQSKKSKGLELG
jgi:hypothetical protein